jgi:methylase of polypeptide subunit release factors
MSDRSELSSILTRALLAAAGARAHDLPRHDASQDLFDGETSGAPESVDLRLLSQRAHRLLADLIALLLLELEGLVDSPLNTRVRARVRLGAPSRSRILAEWGLPLREAEPGELFDEAARATPMPVAANPEAFFGKVLDSARSTARALHLTAPTIEELIRWLLPVIARCAPEDDPVGWIHAHALRHQLQPGLGQRLRFQVDRERGRSHGVLYTPPPLTEALVDAVLTRWAERPPSPASGSMFDSAGATPGVPPPERVLDPSCGSGQFLLSVAHRFLEGREGKPEEILSIFRSLHGVDIDPAAATLAGLNLSLQAVRALCRTQGADAGAVVPWLQDQLGPGFPWFLGSQIHQGNALLLATTDGGHNFRWTDRFAAIFAGDRPGFDIVIGNPPWVSYGLRDRAGPGEEESAYLRRLYTFGAQYKLSLYPLFIELALRLTRPGGYHGFLVPDSFFTGRHFSRIRAHLLEESQPLLFCLVEAGPWPGVHVGHTAFYCVRRRPTHEPDEPVMTRVLQLPQSTRRSRRTARSKLPLFGAPVERNVPVRVEASVFRDTPHHAFRIFREEGERRFVETIERAPLRCEDLIETYSGLIARFGQETVTGPREGEFVLLDRSGKEILRDAAAGRRWRPALHSGAEVEAFRTRWRGGTLYVPEDYEILRKVYKSGFDIERYAGPKVLLRQTGDRMVAARDLRGFLCLNNVHILTVRDDADVDLRFVCGLLLSETMQRYYQVIALEAGRPLAQVDLVTVRSLPYPCDRSGEPFGQALPPSRLPRAAAAVVRAMEDGVRGRRTADALDPVERALGGERDGGVRAIATAAVCRLVEILESEPAPETDRTARETLDGVIALLFQGD